MNTTILDPWNFPLPLGWQRVNLKYISTMKGRLGWQNLRADEYTADGPYLVTSEHFTNDRVAWERCYHVSEDRFAMAPEIQLRPDDLLMMKDGAAMGKLAYVDSLPGPACLNSHLLLFRPVRKVFLNRFLYYVLTAPLFTTYMMQECSGSTFFGISQESMGRFPLSFPPIASQVEIVEYLDHRTAQIDELIAKKERLIALLEEKRRAVISHVVTRGLEPAAQFKDSGIPWLGRVPAHWRLMRLRHLLTRIEQGWSPEAENREAELDEWAVMRAGCVNRGYFDERDHKALPANLSPIPTLEIKPGDLLMSRASGSADLVGSVALVTHCRPKLMICDKLYRLEARQDRTSAAFLEMVLKSSGIRYQIERNLGGADGLARNIGQGVVQELLVCVPPKPEQVRVLEYLSGEARRINAVMQRCRDGIARLQEYRTALISSAVTGQIDVRGVVTR